MSKTPTPITPIILSGGSGTRLWPLSRQTRPKQFLPLLGEESLFSLTLSRVAADGFAAPIILTNVEHRFLVAETCQAANIAPDRIVLEPVARNTAPAIATAALMVVDKDPDGLMLVLPSDHAIGDAEQFRDAVRAAAPAAEEGSLVTFGVTPTGPATGYGYIRIGERLPEPGDGHRVAGFKEKPDRQTAETYLSEGGYFWNAGIFLFGARGILAELERLEPDIVRCSRQALDGAEEDLDFLRLGADAFAENKTISIDYAVMERTETACVYPLRTDWSDIGSFAALAAVGEPDDDGNTTHGKIAAIDSRGNYLHSERPLIAAIGVENLIIVATDDAVLVLPKERAEQVGQVAGELTARIENEIVGYRREYRPWGFYQNLTSGPDFLVKQLVVKPGQLLSLQRHKYRAEHWVVVEGVARVTNGDETFDLEANQSTYIPVGAVHRLENQGSDPLRLIEVQAGTYIGEDDIERLEDVYGRS